MTRRGSASFRTRTSTTARPRGPLPRSPRPPCRAPGPGQARAGLPYTCWYWNSQDHLIEADIKFKQDENWITTRSVPAGCEGRLHLESVATHEMGHVFGLLHPAGDHPKLTMQAGGACDASKATLGRGDVLGLEAHY